MDDTIDGVGTTEKLFVVFQCIMYYASIFRKSGLKPLDSVIYIMQVISPEA